MIVCSREVGHVCLPVADRRLPEVLERVEDGELHIGIDAVNQRDAAVAEVEDDRVLVRLPRWPDHPARALFEGEAAVGIGEPVNADAPELVRLGWRQVRVGDDELRHRLRS